MSSHLLERLLLRQGCMLSQVQLCLPVTSRLYYSFQRLRMSSDSRLD